MEVNVISMKEGRFSYKEIEFVIPIGSYDSDEIPDIVFTTNDNYLSALKTGNSTPIYEILVEWKETDQYKKIDEVMDFRYMMSCGSDIDYWYNGGLGTKFYSQETYDELNKLLNNEYLNEEYKLQIKKWISSRSLEKPKKEKFTIPGYIYLVFSSGLYKIGKSKNFEKRTKYFSTIMPVDVILIHSFHSKDYNIAESKLHKKYKEYRKTGEWFDLNEEQISEIRSIKDDTF